MTPDTPEGFETLGLIPGEIQQWEDGLRTDPSQTSFEWWYLDCGLEDGSKLIAEFHTKPPMGSPRAPLTPFVAFTLDRSDGSNETRTLMAEPGEFFASRESCDVRIGRNTFAADLHRCEVHLELDDLRADLVLAGTVPAWRPGTGHVLCGDDHVAWLPSIPRGDVSGTLELAGEAIDVTGVGYHDHNWGTAALRKLVDHWYWGRARIGDYTALTLNFISHRDFGMRRHPALMIARGSEILIEGRDEVEFSADDIQPQAATGAPVANRLEYAVEEGGERYSVRFERSRDVFTADFGRAGSYHRFVGAATIEHLRQDRLVDSERDDALWELLYFGATGGSGRNVPADAGLVHKP